jgi:hypothetical protein
MLDRFQPHIDNLIKSTPKITAVRVGSYLRDNVDSEFEANERTLRKYVEERRNLLVPKEAYIRAKYEPGGQSQFDFSPMTVKIAGVLAGCPSIRVAAKLQRPVLRTRFNALR